MTVSFRGLVLLSARSSLSVPSLRARVATPKPLHACQNIVDKEAKACTRAKQSPARKTEYYLVQVLLPLDCFVSANWRLLAMTVSFSIWWLLAMTVSFPELVLIPARASLSAPSLRARVPRRSIITYDKTISKRWRKRA
jgi:hypothetical protein